MHFSPCNPLKRGRFLVAEFRDEQECACHLGPAATRMLNSVCTGQKTSSLWSERVCKSKFLLNDSHWNKLNSTYVDVKQQQQIHKLRSVEYHKHFVPWPVFCSDHSDHISIWYLSSDLCNLKKTWNEIEVQFLSFCTLGAREGGQLFTSAVVRRHSIHLSKRIKRVSWTCLTIISWVTWTTDRNSWLRHGFGYLCRLLEWADRT